MRIVIVGTGYVGLVSGTCFAEIGHDVLCVDRDAGKIASLNQGHVPIYEPGLAPMIERNCRTGRLSFATSMPALDRSVDVVVIAVGTPPSANGHGADLSAVYAAATEIAEKAQDGVLVLTKSTVPAGTGEALEHLIAQRRPGLRFTVASNPEFLREGSAIADFLRPDRIVIGTDDPHAIEVLKQLYAPIAASGTPVVCTSRATAEIIKYSANAFLALKISFINEVADLCEVAMADVRDVAIGMGLDHRIGPDFLAAGPGFGGSCFPKDAAALVTTAQELGVNMRLVESAISVNEKRKHAMGLRVIRAMGGQAMRKSVAVLGLTFKANTDDMRDAPSLALISALQKAGAKVRVYDPEGMTRAAEHLLDVEYARSSYECVEGVDCAVLVTDWKEFTDLDLHRLGNLMRSRVFIDLRNAIDPAKLLGAGFRLHAIGRGSGAGHEAADPASRTRTRTIRQARTAARVGGAQPRLALVDGSHVSTP
jgi:UDPglucose 6-dehydrogenase